MQGIRFAPHNISSPLGTMASAHVCATLPNFVALEFHGSDVPFWNDLIERADVAGPVIKHGRIPLTAAPGMYPQMRLGAGLPGSRRTSSREEQHVI